MQRQEYVSLADIDHLRCDAAAMHVGRKIALGKPNANP